MADWAVWLVASGVLLLAELFTLTFVLGLVSAAALLTAIGGALGLPLAAQVGVFAVSNAALFATVRPFERRHQSSPVLVTGSAALTGRNAVVTEEISEHNGRVKIGGESWAARPLAPGSTIPAGRTVAIARVDGATVVVYPEEL